MNSLSLYTKPPVEPQEQDPSVMPMSWDDIWNPKPTQSPYDQHYSVANALAGNILHPGVTEGNVTVPSALDIAASVLGNQTPDLGHYNERAIPTEKTQFTTLPNDKNLFYNAQSAGPPAFATAPAPAAPRNPLYDEWDRLIASQIAKYGGYDQKTALDMAAKKAGG